MKKTYTVTKRGRIMHNDVRYFPGDDIELTEAEMAALPAGAVQEKVDAERLAAEAKAAAEAEELAKLEAEEAEAARIAAEAAAGKAQQTGKKGGK